MKKIHTLSFKVPVIISGIILVIITALTFLSALSSSNAIKNSALYGFKSTVSGYSHMIDMILHEQLLAIATYSQSGTLLDAILYPDNEEYINRAALRLKDFSSVNNYTINVGLADINGSIIIDDSNPKLKGVSIAEVHIDMFERMKANNYAFTYDNEVTIASTTGGQAMMLCGGIKNSLGKVVGLVYINLDLAKVNRDFIANLKFDGRITVANKEREVILSSEQSSIGSTLPEVYRCISSKSDGVIESYMLDGDKNKRSSAYQSIKTMPWSVIFARYDNDIYKEVKIMVTNTITISIIFIIVSAVIVTIYIKSITRPLKQLVSISHEISLGNLSSDNKSIKRKDELGILANSFYEMRDKLSEIIINVRTSADEINFNVKSLAQGTLNLSRRTEAQAASLEETASSMEEIASTIKSSTDQSVEGNKMMISAKSSIQDAGDIILETTQNIEDVYEASTKIKNITKIIEDIAFQTNILALNAAVEAARAGEQGKGFAVVASEVRNLAQTTQTSVKDITHLVDNAYEKINRATDSARTSQDIFNELQTKMDETAHIMQDITSTAVEQQAGVDQINRAVTEMDSVTQQNAALVEEAYASSDSLMKQAELLVEAMSFFKVSEHD